MGKGRAALETIIVSVLIPVILWTLAKLFMFTLSFLFLSFVGLIFVYYYFVFTRHKHLGKLFVFLTAVLSTLIQFIVIILEIVSLSPLFDSSEGGHPNGGAILVLIILSMQPVIYNIAAIIIWIMKKIIDFFSMDDGGDEKEDVKE